MEQINSNKKHSNRRKYFSLLAVVLFIAFSGAYAYWSMELEDMISTDDAYVTGNADRSISDLHSNFSIRRLL